jgi:hypothetical protein
VRGLVGPVGRDDSWQRIGGRATFYPPGSSSESGGVTVILIFLHISLLLPHCVICRSFPHSYFFDIPSPFKLQLEKETTAARKETTARKETSL